MKTGRRSSSVGAANGGSTRIPIADPDLLARLLTRAIEKEFEGNLNSAAEKVGLAQPTLYRYARRSGTGYRTKRAPSPISITRNVLKRISKLVGKRPLLKAVASPYAHTALRNYRLWNESFKSLTLVESQQERALAVPRPRSVQWTDRGEEFWLLWARTQKEVTHVHHEVTQFLDLAVESKTGLRGRNSIEQKKGLRSEIQPERIQTAIYRIFLPLLEAKRSGWIERTALELSPAEFKRFVEKGWEREKILLNRPGDLERAQRFPLLADLALAAGSSL